jgi:hypothetical protein
MAITISMNNQPQNTQSSKPINVQNPYVEKAMRHHQLAKMYLEKAQSHASTQTGNGCSNGCSGSSSMNHSTPRYAPVSKSNAGPGISMSINHNGQRIGINY